MEHNSNFWLGAWMHNCGIFNGLAGLQWKFAADGERKGINTRSVSLGWGRQEHFKSKEVAFFFFFFSWVGHREEVMFLLGARTSMKCFLLLCESTLWWRNMVLVNPWCFLLNRESK